MVRNWTWVMHCEKLTVYRIIQICIFQLLIRRRGLASLSCTLPHGSLRCPPSVRTVKSTMKLSSFTARQSSIAKSWRRPDPEIFCFWYCLSGVCPRLSKRVFHIYATPPTSCALERDFSIVNRIITPQRNRLNISTTEDLIIFHAFTDARTEVYDIIHSFERCPKWGLSHTDQKIGTWHTNQRTG